MYRVISFYRENVQSKVERPYLHMIGRSTATYEDQAKYTSERVDEIITMMTGLEFQGRTYYATARLFSGRLTAIIYTVDNNFLQKIHLHSPTVLYTVSLLVRCNLQK